MTSPTHPSAEALAEPLLLPCPMCGGAAGFGRLWPSATDCKTNEWPEDQERHFVSCPYCGLSNRNAFDFGFATQAVAAERWNTRSESAPAFAREPNQMHARLRHFESEWLAALARERAGAELLRDMEWMQDRDQELDLSDLYSCPWCGAIKSQGHDPNCRLAAHLARTGGGAT